MLMGKIEKSLMLPQRDHRLTNRVQRTRQIKKNRLNFALLMDGHGELFTTFLTSVNRKPKLTMVRIINPV